MKLLRATLVFGSLLIASSLCFAQASKTWKTFKPQGSIFSVNLPGTPASQTQSASDPESGNLKVMLYMLTADNFAYVLEDVKADRIPNDTSKVLLDFQGGFLRTSGMELVSGQDTKYKGYVARNFTFKKGTKQVRGFAVIVGTRILAFFGGGEATQMNAPNLTKFFNSIKINGK